MANQGAYSQHQERLEPTAMKADGDSSEDIHFRDIAPAIELVCWILAGLAPMLRLINGAAVTTDQFVIEVALFSVALVGAIGLRFYNALQR